MTLTSKQSSENRRQNAQGRVAFASAALGGNPAAGATQVKADAKAFDAQPRSTAAAMAGIELRVLQYGFCIEITWVWNRADGI
jgi:hypothetical protein